MLSFETLLQLLKASGEATRLRMLMLLSEQDLTVKDMTQVMGQSQPRISRHLKLLCDADLISRRQEGSWVFYSLNEDEAQRSFIKTFAHILDFNDKQLFDDKQRLNRLREDQAIRAQEYFSQQALKWDILHPYYVPQEDVEKALLNLALQRPFKRYLDLGTGTGKLLYLLRDHYESALGIDKSADMLNVARSKLYEKGLAKAQVRQGDVLALSHLHENYDLITMHQVLHYFDDPFSVVREAAQKLAPCGRLIIIDFAPHNFEQLRDDHEHRRLGFEDGLIASLFEKCDLNFTDSVSIMPEKDSPQKLEVKIWVGEDRRAAINELPLKVENILHKEKIKKDHNA